MAILEGIQIKNFRALKDVTLGRVLSNKQTELPRLVAIIGANGSGKSSVLDALGFLSDCLREGVEAACDKPHRKGFDSLRTRGSKEPIEFELRYRYNDDTPPINYILHIDANANGVPYVAWEKLLHKPVARLQTDGKKQGTVLKYLDIRRGTGWAWTGKEEVALNKKKITLENDQELAISSLHALKEHQQISQFRNFMMGWYLSFFDPDKARALPAAGAQAHLSRTGDNLANYLQYIQRQPYGTGFKRMLNRMANKIPGIKKIVPSETRDKRLLLEFYAEGFEKDTPFFQHEMSDGTLKMLAYLSLLEDPAPPPLIGIEEPENGLYQSLLTTLAHEFKQATQNALGVQILLTTHSTQLVDGLSPEEVWVLDKNKDGHSIATRTADIKGINEFYAQDLTLGNLWYSNHFGPGLS